MSGTKTSAGSGIAIVVLAGVVIIAAASVLSREPGQTDLPPDPFEGEEPRAPDSERRSGSSRGRFRATADSYCEVGNPENSDDKTGLDLSPYIWSTTGNSGEVAIVDLHLSREDSGLCELWVDGELFESEPVVQVLDDEGEVPIYACSIETPIP